MYTLDVLLSPAELSRTELTGKTVVVIDALRATSTIAAALANGCVAVHPVSTQAEALAMRNDKPDVLLVGERGGEKIPGFDLGNSPTECYPENVFGKEMVLTTSNGTPLLLACVAADLVLTAAFVNRGAVADYCLANSAQVLIACAGQGGKASFEDVACAGSIVDAIMTRTQLSPDLSDGAQLAWMSFTACRSHLREALDNSSAGKKLHKLNYGGDVAWCAQLDALDVVPSFDGKAISGVKRLHKQT